MVSIKRPRHPTGEIADRIMKIVPYELGTTNDLLTSRAELLILAQLMNSIGFADLADQHFPAPNSNRGFKPSTFVDSVIVYVARRRQMPG